MLPFFTLSNARSGTLYLRYLFQNNVPNCVCRHEPFFDWGNPTLFGPAIYDAYAGRVDRIRRRLEKKRAYLERLGGQFYLESSHAFLKSAYLAALDVFPNLRLIHLVRDPIAVAKSQAWREFWRRRLHAPFHFYTGDDGRRHFAWALTGNEQIFRKFDQGRSSRSGSAPAPLDTLSLTPRLSGVETLQRGTVNRFNGLVTRETVKTVSFLLRQLVTPPKRGVNSHNHASCITHHAPVSPRRSEGGSPITLFQWYLLEWIEIENRAMHFLDQRQLHDRCFTLACPDDLNNPARIRAMFDFFGLPTCSSEPILAGRKNRSIGYAPSDADDCNRQFTAVISALPARYLEIFQRPPYTGFRWCDQLHQPTHPQSLKA